jgi:hypothetical protein
LNDEAARDQRCLVAGFFWARLAQPPAAYLFRQKHDFEYAQVNCIPACAVEAECEVAPTAGALTKTDYPAVLGELTGILRPKVRMQKIAHRSGHFRALCRGLFSIGWNQRCLKSTSFQCRKRVYHFDWTDKNNGITLDDVPCARDSTLALQQQVTVAHRESIRRFAIYVRRLNENTRDATLLSVKA